LQPKSEVHMKNPAKIVLPALVAILLAGCCPCRSYQKKTRRPLTGTEWQLVQLGGRSVRPEEGKFVVVFSPDGSRLSGRGACNGLTGRFESDEKRSLRIDRMASTRMTCPEIEQEQAFIRALESTTHYDMDGPMLLLLSDGELRAVLQAL